LLPSSGANYVGRTFVAYAHKAGTLKILIKKFRIFLRGEGEKCAELRGRSASGSSVFLDDLNDAANVSHFRAASNFVRIWTLQLEVFKIS
jgi:hypothetical protein